MKPRDFKIEDGFCFQLQNFEYTVNKKELRIQDIFVKYFN